MENGNQSSVNASFLRHHSLFGGLSDKDLEYVRARLKEKRFARKEIIIREGDPGDRLYFIKEGSVEVLKKNGPPEHQTEKKIATLYAGDTFGEMALIDMEARSATVRALEPTVTLILTSNDLYEISQKNLQAFTIIFMNIAREVSRRLREMDDRYASCLYALKG